MISVALVPEKFCHQKMVKLSTSS